MLVVDDDDDVHLATELALRGVSIEGRLLTLLHARSAAQAFDIVAARPDVAVVLLDVVMERPDAGLQLVRRVRGELQRAALRIILRTGQPGYAPEIQTVRDFDINDYCTKSELTAVRLFTSLTTAIRSYRQHADVLRQRDELAALNADLLQSRAAERAQAEQRLAAEQALRLAHESIEQCVEQRTRELMSAIGELESFNAMVSHDLRGPLSGIAGLSELLQEDLRRGETANLRPWLALVGTQTRRLAALVEDLLNLARVSKGELQRRRLPLQPLVHEALQALALGKARSPVPEVSVGDLPELVVDAGLMRQVFVNLLDNALKFTEHVPEPRIEVQAEARDNEWLLSVRDNGPGFAPDQAQQLFKPFTRLHGTRFPGHGIGLTVVRRIVERHGGRIWAEGQVGGGATISFSLPASPGAGAASAPDGPPVA